MAEVGSLELKADSRGIVTATKNLKDLDKQAARTEKAASKVGNVIGLIGAAAVIGGIRSIVRATAEAEKAQAQLGAVLKSTGGIARQTKDSLNANAAALQKVTTFGDETINTAQSMLLTFRNIAGETFPRATKVTLDLATAMGTDLKSASIQVGKALNDPSIGLTALSRSGITFSEAQTTVIKKLQETGRLAEAQAVILKELETQFGGSAEAARNTLGGALEGLSNAFGDLLEGDGSATGVTKAINDLTDTLNNPAVKAGFAAMVSGSLSVIGVLADAGAAVGGFSEILKQRFTDDAEKSVDGLLFKLVDLDDKLANLTRKNVLGINNNRIKQTEDEIAATQRLVIARREQERVDKLIAGATFTTISGAPSQAGESVTPARSRSGGGNNDAQRELERIMREADDAAGGLTDTLRDLASEQGGPSLQAAQQLSDRLLDLTMQQEALSAAGRLDIDTQTQINAARDQAQESFARSIQAINDEAQAREDAANAAANELTNNERFIESLQFELSLIGLTNDERLKAIDLRNLDADATQEQIDAVGKLSDELAAASERQRSIDELKGSISNLFVDFASGAKSAKDAFADFTNSIIQRALETLANRALDQLFGSFGNGSGSGGGSSFLGSLFGGGRALGGNIERGKLHQVNERGNPELLNVGNKQFVMSPQGGNVQPINARSGGQTNITVNLPPEARAKTAAQIAQDVSRIQRRAEARTS